MSIHQRVTLPDDDQYERWVHSSDGDDYEPPPLWLIAFATAALLLAAVFVVAALY